MIRWVWTLAKESGDMRGETTGWTTWKEQRSRCEQFQWFQSEFKERKGDEEVEIANIIDKSLQKFNQKWREINWVTARKSGCGHNNWNGSGTVNCLRVKCSNSFSAINQLRKPCVNQFPLWVWISPFVISNTSPILQAQKARFYRGIEADREGTVSGERRIFERDWYNSLRAVKRVLTSLGE